MDFSTVNLTEFARQTVLTHDLDPTYDLLANLSKKRPPEYISKVCLYMLMFYDLRGALENSKLKGDKFWRHIEVNYKTLPRGAERRHFRGQLGWGTFIELRAEYPKNPERFMLDTYDSSLLAMEKKIRQFPNFGPYFIWKAADYQDRILGHTVNYRDNLAILPEQPRKAAQLFFPNQSFTDTLCAVESMISNLPAPGLHDRYCSISEAETVLCMAKTHFVTKQAHIGKDIELRRAEMRGTEYEEFLP